MDPLIQALLRPEAYDHPVGRLEVLQTHISWVILAGEFAYKLKKPVDFGFVNFVTLESRQHFCEEEVRLNRRLAAAMYLGVKPVHGPPDKASFVGQGEPIEYAVQMRQFSQTCLLPAVLQRGELTRAHLDQCADMLAEFHEQAAVAQPDAAHGSPESVWEPMAENLKVLQSMAAVRDRVTALTNWAEGEFERLKDLFLRRKQEGRVRECHGDLHLGNMLLSEHESGPAGGRIEAFDCLEFNPALRWIDVLSEMAFLGMDLVAHGRPDLAFRVLNRWLEQSGDYRGLDTWRWYFAYRALVRAKVAALRAAQADRSADEVASDRREVEQHVSLAEGATRSQPRAVIVTHGVSGSGKSHVTNMLVKELGAIRLRSDVERKRLFGTWGPSTNAVLAGDPYRSEVTEKVYREVLPGLATAVVAAGFPVIVDATFLSHGRRGDFRELADRLQVPFVILEFEISPLVARSRILQRQQAGNDPSDAGPAILEQQLATDEPLTAEERERAVVVPLENSDSGRLVASVRERLVHMCGAGRHES